MQKAKRCIERSGGGMNEFNYECDGQMSIFDILNKPMIAYNLQMQPIDLSGKQIEEVPCGIYAHDTKEIYLYQGKFYKISNKEE